jgi:predicted house-cleaning noncanonical NTP pyrophosphatase (MazG superfamily)
MMGRWNSNAEPSAKFELTKLITGVTLVVTIDQLVLSQETGPSGNQRERMSGAQDFRDAVEEFFGTTSPSEPNAFLQVLVDAANERATTLNERVADSDNDDLQDDVEEFVESVVGNAETVSDELENTQFGHYDVVRAALDFNYGIKIHRARKISEEYANDLTDDMQEALNDLIDVLNFTVRHANTSKHCFSNGNWLTYRGRYCTYRFRHWLFRQDCSCISMQGRFPAEHLG